MDSESSKNTKLEEKVKELEERLNRVLSGKVDLEVISVENSDEDDAAIAPRSKLRVACE